MALIVVDMPFGYYEESPKIAFRNAAWVIKETGCGAVKLEGGACMADTIGFFDPTRYSSDGSYRPDTAIEPYYGGI